MLGFEDNNIKSIQGVNPMNAAVKKQVSKQELETGLNKVIKSQQKTYDAWVSYCARIAAANIKSNLSNSEADAQRLPATVAN